MPDILTTADVMQRYGVERHTAANIMRKAFAFKIGKRLYVRQRDLMNYEESLTMYPVSRSERFGKAVRSPVTKIPRRKA